MDTVGRRIRDLRKEQGWTLRELSRKCDLSTSFLSQVERGLSSVSITSLHVICQSLGTTLAAFFRDMEEGSDAVAGHRPADILRGSQEPAITVSDATIKYRFLSRDFPGRKFEIMIGEISPGFQYPPSGHEGEEFGYVLEGQLRLIVDDAEYSLAPGDSYHFDATTKHGYEVDGDESVRVLWVQTLKYFQSRGGRPTRATVE